MAITTFGLRIDPADAAYKRLPGCAGRIKKLDDLMKQLSSTLGLRPTTVWCDPDDSSAEEISQDGTENTPFDGRLSFYRQ